MWGTERHLDTAALENGSLALLGATGLPLKNVTSLGPGEFGDEYCTATVGGPAGAYCVVLGGNNQAYKVAHNDYYKAKDYANAIGEYIKALGIEPFPVTYLSRRVAAFTRVNRFEETLEDAYTASGIDHSNPQRSSID
ncbi:hypothetical protein HO173_003042 [Letharia columbiana]|uniref:Uncharacterized protein n=1 Tax=Letharia columbiana TaxID=112416 RepID=A0A8H6G157_9LECA|nr:uncharacterized protein HO173_003042 [Letharia columbiana]KAF6238537.1 hypothetical protein HO173_003042 [Letharia columbiana]